MILFNSIVVLAWILHKKEHFFSDIPRSYFVFPPPVLDNIFLFSSQTHDN